MEKIEKVKKLWKEGKLFNVVYNRYKPLAKGLKYIFHEPSMKKIVIHCPKYCEVPKDKKEMELVERIYNSFKAMKSVQEKVSKKYLPSALWQEQLNKSYSSLLSNDLSKFHFFLCNFGTWKTYHGIESTTLIHSNSKNPIRKLYLKNDVFFRSLKIWQWFYNNRKPLKRLSYPTYGNQAGAYIDNTFVGVGSFFNEIYGSILSGLIKDKEHPVIVDLGAGYGKLSYFILRDIDKFTFIDLDLPEVLCLAAYYLMKVWPDKKALLYGEDAYSEKSYKMYDMIFMPPQEIEKIGENSVDLLVNKNSLGEMTKEAVENYMRYILKATKYFFHMNHDIYPNYYGHEERGLLGYEYPIDNFKLLFRYPDISHMLYLGGLDFHQDIFLYLYERKKQ
ncbi:MAG: putative sugar O-methyltransferase [Candidatus Omnitrophota bacterium]